MNKTPWSFDIVCIIKESERAESERTARGVDATG